MTEHVWTDLPRPRRCLGATECFPTCLLAHTFPSFPTYTPIQHLRPPPPPPPFTPNLRPHRHLHNPQIQPPPPPASAPALQQDTFRVVAQLGRCSLGTYVISMAKSASDVLAVELLQREAQMQVGKLEGGSGT